VLGDGRVTIRRRIAVCLLAVVAAACQPDAPGKRDANDAAGTAASAAARTARNAERCDVATTSVVVDSLGIGPVLRGTRIAQLASRCPVTDTVLPPAEGTPERGHIVTVRGHPIVVLSTGTPDTSIIRVMTVDPAFKTTGGVGVGSSVQALRLAHGRICAARGEGGFVDFGAGDFEVDLHQPPCTGGKSETWSPSFKMWLGEAYSRSTAMSVDRAAGASFGKRS